MQIGEALAQLREGLFGKPADSVDIGPIVHRTREDQRLLVRRVRAGPRGVGREAVCVHAIAQHVQRGVQAWREFSEQRRFVRGDEEAAAGLARHLLFVGQQLAALAAVDPGHGPAVVLGVLAPLGRVHIGKVDQHGQLRQCFGVLRHGRGEHHRRIELDALGQALAPGMQLAAAVVRQAQRFAGQQALRALELGLGEVEWHGMHFCADAAQHVQMLPVVRVVHENAQVHAVLGGQVREEMVGTELVALVGGIRQAVPDIKQIGHGFSRGCAR